jgi:chemotaxis signal transduction protein
MAGVTNHRGMILGVVDLARFFGGTPAAQAAEPTARHVILVGAAGPEFGLVVDAAVEIRLIQDSRVQRREGAADRQKGLVEGMTPEAVLILDGQALLREKSFKIDQQGSEGQDSVR